MGENTIARVQRAAGVIVEYRVDSSNADNFSDGESLDLSGVRILIVEDSWQLGIALKSLLLAWGADVSGPVATSADAQRLASEQAPHAALVDFSLRGGERADGLVDELHDQGVYVIVTSGYPVLPVALRHAAAILQKPLSEAQLLGSLRPVLARKAQP
jgi:DNA-binding response OmpR family regulator